VGPVPRALEMDNTVILENREGDIYLQEMLPGREDSESTREENKINKRSSVSTI
jgi:hypothetical protein